MSLLPTPGYSTKEHVILFTTSSPFRGYDLPLDVTTYGIPLAFTVLVVMILCIVIAYTKVRRRRERQLRGDQNNLRSISGGVPMNVAAYRNYGMHLGMNAHPGGMPIDEHLGANYLTDLPPPYEEAIQTPSSNPQNYIVTSQLPAPPAYSASISTNSGIAHSPGMSPVPFQPGQHIQPSLPQDSSSSSRNIISTMTPADQTSIGLNVDGKPEDGNKKESDSPEVDCNPRVPKPQAGTSGQESLVSGSDGDGDVRITEATPSELHRNQSSSHEEPGAPNSV